VYLRNEPRNATRHNMNRSVTILTSLRPRAAGVLGLLFVTGLLLAPPALANFEQVKSGPPVFEDPPHEHEFLLRRTGIAINVSGAGGVSPGTVYTAGRGESGGVHRYNSDAEFQ